jgi:excisionase family DNA binding protein
MKNLQTPFSKINNQDKNHPSQLFENLIWLNSAEAALYLRVTTANLRVMVCRGHLKPYKLLNRLRFKRSELDALLESSLKKGGQYGH